MDLLWNGGIGTYVKATIESHTDVGDKSNDALRVDGAQLRCRVIGEGGNLGMTQLDGWSTAWRAGAAIPISLTMPAAWIAPTTRSISRFCWIRSSPAEI